MQIQADSDLIKEATDAMTFLSNKVEELYRENQELNDQREIIEKLNTANQKLKKTLRENKKYYLGRIMDQDSIIEELNKANRENTKYYLGRIRDQDRIIEEPKGEIDRRDGALNNWGERVKEIYKQIDQRDEEIAGLKEEIEKLVSENTELYKEKKGLRILFHDTCDRRNKLQIEVTNCHTRNRCLNEALGKQSIRISDLEYEVEELEEHLAESKQHCQKQEEAIRILEKANQELKHKVMWTGRKDHD